MLGLSNRVSPNHSNHISAFQFTFSISQHDFQHNNYVDLTINKTKNNQDKVFLVPVNKSNSDTCKQ